MNYFNWNRVLIGLVILITVINLGSLGTMIYLQSNDEDDCDRYERSEYRNKKSYKDKDKESYFKSEKFKDYMDAVREDFKEEVAPHAREIRGTQSAIMRELMKENPNQNKLDSLASKAGDLHYNVKKNMINVFMERNQQADSAEKEMLRKFYRHFMVESHEKDRKKRRYKHDKDKRKQEHKWKD